jgi:hypothetical protein
MPFANHYVEPERIEAMRSAFHKVCDALLLKCDVDDPMTEIIVTKIVDLAKAGEHDADQLAELVLNDLADDAPPHSGDPAARLARGAAHREAESESEP